jgi:hypothetical protein
MKFIFPLLATCLGLAGLGGCTSTTTVTPPAGSDTSCQPDTSVDGCSGGASGFSCGNGLSPDQTDSSLICSDGVAGSDGFTLYCCVQFTSQTSCAPDSSVAGCDPSSIGFSCTGSDTPDEADSSLNCSDATQGNGGELLYCCTP